MLTVEVKLPTIEDFTYTPNGVHDLDGFHAWKEFGGLTIDDAYKKFCQVPDNYQEDFMFMGDAAFIFYFPVIDKYIREEEAEYANIFDGKKCPFDGETHILAHCIGIHVSDLNPAVRPLYERIVNLCQFVLEGLKVATIHKHRCWQLEDIRIVWTELLEKATALM